MSSIKVIPFNENQQEEVDHLLIEIAHEYKESFFSSNPKTNIKILDKYWVATNKGKVIGTVAVIKTKKKRAVLKKMFVKKEFRGKEKGVSDLLLQTVLNWCIEQKISQIFLGTMTQFKAAQKFYKKNGFYRIEEIKVPTDILLNPVDDVFYRKDLHSNDLQFRTGNINDLKPIMALAFLSWKGYKNKLTPENWNKLHSLLIHPNHFIDLLNNSHCILCETNKKEIIGMAFLVPSGNPTDIYEEAWSYIRFVSVNPLFKGQKIGLTLTEKCLKHAKENHEKLIALHTSEMMQNAMAIYERLGFKILRELEPRLGKRYWLYTLEL